MLFAAALVAVFTLPAIAVASNAPIPGPNGKILFTSGRDDGLTALDDAHAQLWTVDKPGDPAQTKGALSFRGKVGLNRVRFQGRLSRRRTLTLGRYRLRVGAVDAAGNRSRTRTTFFRIVRR